MPSNQSFTDMVIGEREDDVGPVWISFDEVSHVSLGKIIRPTAVWGVVVPQPTSARPDPPEPICGFPIEGIKRHNRGHVMALQLGGPNTPANIVPQWAGWQGNGVWSKMEKAIRNDAEQLPSGTKLFFHCAVIYYSGADPRQMSEDRVRYPKGFIVTTRTVVRYRASAPTVRFSGDQLQDATDFLIPDRQAVNAEVAESRKATASELAPDYKVKPGEFRVDEAGKVLLDKWGQPIRNWVVKQRKEGVEPDYQPLPVPPLTYSMANQGPVAIQAFNNAAALAALDPGISVVLPTRDEAVQALLKRKQDAHDAQRIRNPELVLDPPAKRAREEKEVKDRMDTT